MRAALFGAVLSCIALTSLGQGQFFFTNRDTTAGVNARFVRCSDAAGTSSIGSPDWYVHLDGGPTGGALLPLEPTEIGFRGQPGSNTAGYVVPVTVTVPGVPPGGSADVRVTLVGPPGAFSMTYTIPSLSGGLATPPTIPMGTFGAYGCTPEPGQTVLWLVSIPVLVSLFHRRTSILPDKKEPQHFRR